MSIIYAANWDIITSFLLLIINFLGLLIIVNLREIIKTILAGEPFTLVNVRRFQNIGLLTIAAGFCYLPFTIANIIRTGVVFFGNDENGIILNIGVLLFVFFGLLALLLVEIFRLSYEIKEESKLTI